MAYWMCVLEHMKLYNLIHEKIFPLHKNYLRWEHNIENIFSLLKLLLFWKKKLQSKKRKKMIS